MKIIASVSFVCFSLLTACAGADKEGSMAFSNTAYAATGDVAAKAPRAVSASRETAAHETPATFHAARGEAEYFVCAQCRH
jgi:hypothetical protein